MKKVTTIAVLALLLLISACATHDPVPLGTASVDKDGVIHAWLRDYPKDRSYYMKLRPNERGYQKWLDHIGEVKPGETKTIPPWPE